MEQERNNFINRINNLQVQLKQVIGMNEELQKKFAELGKRLSKESQPKTPTVEDQTDEEELARETE